MNMPRGRDLVPPRDSARAATRRRLVVVAVVLLVLGAVAAAVWVVFLREVEDPVAAEPCPTALPAGALLPPSGEVTLEVLNSTPTDGLAARTAEELTARGFSVTRVDNLPGTAPLPTTEVRARPDARVAADLVAFHVPGAAVVEDPALAVPVDIRIGEGFAGLAPPEAVAAEVERRNAAARARAVAAAPERCRPALESAPPRPASR